MGQARDLLREVRRDLAPTEARIRQHPYLAAVRAGRVPQEGLRALPGTQYNMWKSDLRSAAHLVERFGDRAYGNFFLADLSAEVGAQEKLLVMARKLGMTEADLEAFEPSAKGFAYAAYFVWLSTYGSAGEVACAMAVNLAAWGDNCAALSEGLRRQYGFSAGETAFLDSFASIPDLEDAAVAILAEDLARGLSPRAVRRAARLIQAYEIEFWDAMAEAAGLPLAELQQAA